MSESIVIEIAGLVSDSQEYAQVINRAADRLQAGEIVVLPIEGGYLFTCDAFQQSAVARIHLIRGDAPGTASQVLLASANVLPGLAQSVSAETKTLISKFWPGPLTIITAPNGGLNWDLGDGGLLGECAMRVPEYAITRAIIEKVGPLAVASASPSGGAPALSLGSIFTLAGEVALYLDGGELAATEPSTVVRVRAGELVATRIGAISLSQLREAIPTIQGANL
jgi:tRNA threonylcarbamoyl adenosine modification protein (Sua5/YciO/YrdC/YwlC family)